MGGIERRKITAVDPTTGKVVSKPNPRPTSRSPVGRYGQRKFEEWSTAKGIKNPSSRWGAPARLGKYEARIAEQQRLMTEAKWGPHIDALIEGVKAPGPTGRARIKEAFTGIARVDPKKGALLQAVAQGPSDVDMHEAGNLAVDEMRDRIAENSEHRELQRDIAADKAAADELSNEIDDLREQVEHGRARRRRRPRRRSRDKREQMADLSKRARQNQQQLEFNVYGKVHPVEDSPQREQILATLTEQFGEAEALEKIGLMDQFARALDPEMPQRLYHQISVSRAVSPDGLVDPLFQRVLPERAPEDPGNVYRQNRLAREAGLEEPHKPPFRMEDAPKTTTRAAKGGAKGAATVAPKTRKYTVKHQLARIKKKIDAGGRGRARPLVRDALGLDGLHPRAREGAPRRQRVPRLAGGDLTGGRRAGGAPGDGRPARGGVRARRTRAAEERPATRPCTSPPTTSLRCCSARTWARTRP